MGVTLFNGDLTILLKSAEFKADVLEHRKMHGIPEAGFRTYSEYFAFCDSLTPEQSRLFHTSIIEKKYHWPSRLGDLLYYYIGTGTPEFEEEAVIVKDSPSVTDMSDRYVTVHIHRDAIFSDLAVSWYEVRVLQKKIGGKFVNQSKRATKRDSRLLDLIFEGKTHKETWKIINKEFPKNQISDYSHVAVILGRLRKRIANIT